MFVKYLTDSDLLDCGFSASNITNLRPESFHRMEASADNKINTLMCMWTDTNVYHYTITTDRDKETIKGSVSKREEVEKLITKYFTNAFETYERRCFDRLDPIQQLLKMTMDNQ